MSENDRKGICYSAASLDKENSQAFGLLNKKGTKESGCKVRGGNVGRRETSTQQQDAVRQHEDR